MKITFITGHLCKERHSLLPELAADLGAYGAEVTILTGYPSRRISDEVRRYYLEHPVERVTPNVTVYRVGSKRGEGRGLFGRMINYVILTFTLYRRAKKTPTDVYYLYSSPPFLGVLGAMLAKKGKKTVFNAQDLFPDNLVRVKSYSERNLLVRFLRRLEKKIYTRNTKIITISQDMKKNIIKNGCPEEKISVIYNWADTESLAHVPREKNTIFDEFGIDRDSFIVSYAGSIGLIQGLDVVLDAAAILLRRNKNIRFVFIGGGSWRDEMARRINDEGLTNVKLLQLLPVSRIPEAYSLGDLELVSFEKGYIQTALPSKTWVIMACGSPLLALVDDKSDLANIINENRLGQTLELNDAATLADVIEKNYNDRALLPEYGQNARAFAEQHRARAAQTRKYYDEIAKLL